MSDRLDQMLRNDARYSVPDDGFTARVMGALPAPRPRRSLQPLIVLGSTALGCALAALLAPADFNIAQGFVDLARLKGFTPAAIAGLATAAALLVSAVVLAVDTD